MAESNWGNTIGGAISHEWGTIDWGSLPGMVFGAGPKTVPGTFDAGGLNFGGPYGYPTSPNLPGGVSGIPHGEVPVMMKQTSGGGTDILPYLIVGIVGIGLVYMLMRKR